MIALSTGGGLLWSMLMFFFFIIYFMMLFNVIGDLFRDPDMGGWGKTLWILFLLVGETVLIRTEE